MGEGDASAGEDGEVECPGVGGAGCPQPVGGVDVLFGLGGGHAGDLAEVGEGPRGAAGDVRVAEVSGAVVGR